MQRDRKPVEVAERTLRGDGALAELGSRFVVAPELGDRREVRERDRRSLVVTERLEQREALAVRGGGAVEVALGAGDRAEIGDASGDALVVLERSVQRQRLAPEPARLARSPWRYGNVAPSASTRARSRSSACSVSAIARSNATRASFEKPRTTQNQRSAVTRRPSSSASPVSTAKASAARRLSWSAASRSKCRS